MRTIIVCLHHSSYSYGKRVGSSPAVQQHFVAPFLNASKTSVFNSGLEHMFRHFGKQGKHLFVINGGLHHPPLRRTGPEVFLESENDPMLQWCAEAAVASPERPVQRVQWGM